MAIPQPWAMLVVHPGTPGERVIPIHDRVFVGRECFGIDDRQRVIIDEPGASRNHFEIRLEPQRLAAYVVDTSTNGTRLNGVRIERGRPMPLASGDHLTIGSVRLEYHSDVLDAPLVSSPLATARNLALGEYVMVAGDVVGFSTMAQSTPSDVMLACLDTLFGHLRRVLDAHRGTLSNLVGDAFFAVWEVGSVERAADLALRFAVDASNRVAEVGTELASSLGIDRPVRMGWGASIGEAAVTSITGTVVGIVGDAANVAFRLSALAAREGRGDVLVTEDLCGAVTAAFPFGPVERVEVKGRAGTEPVRTLYLASTPEGMDPPSNRAP